MLHDVRHSYASAALAAGIAAKVVSERLGHATIAITMDTYSHVLPGLDERAAATVAQLILEGDEPASASIDKALTTGLDGPVERRDAKGGEARSARSDAVAEADGNRTRLSRVAAHTGFEDRGAHQDPDASKQAF
jgi:hypothetical protein